jgi:hypothetical protein
VSLELRQFLTINDSKLRGLIEDCITPFNDSVRDEQLIYMKKRKAVKSAHSAPPRSVARAATNSASKIRKHL